MKITITNKDGLDQISTFSENKIKHITQNNQWRHVIETILRDSNKENIKKSVVEFLIEELNNIKSSSTDQNGKIKFLENEFNELLQQAKDMENQQGYSEEEVINFLQEMNNWPTTFEGRIDVREWFEKFKNK
jgi:uncharacterized protein (UPF0305 family)